MRKTAPAAALLLLLAIPSFAGKLQGSTPLKDVQAAGVKDKQHKHQTFDLSFDAQGKSYVCRTDSNKSMDATHFVVGAIINYEINGNKVNLKNTDGKKVECKVVRVEMVSASTPAAAAPTASPQ
jgi:hypothetical protein